MRTKIVSTGYVRAELRDNDLEQPWTFEREIVTDREIARDTPECYQPVGARLWAMGNNGVTWYDAKSYRRNRGAVQSAYLSNLTVDEMWKRLKGVTPMSLKKAVAAILWWDLVSYKTPQQFRAMKKANKNFDAFCEFATYPDKVGAMDKWILRKEGTGTYTRNGIVFAEALMKFGYFREVAINRVTESAQPMRETVKGYNGLEGEIRAQKKITLKALKQAKDIEDKARVKAARIVSLAQEKAAKIEAAAAAKEVAK